MKKESHVRYIFKKVWGTSDQVELLEKHVCENDLSTYFCDTYNLVLVYHFSRFLKHLNNQAILHK